MFALLLSTLWKTPSHNIRREAQKCLILCFTFEERERSSNPEGDLVSGFGTFQFPARGFAAASYFFQWLRHNHVHQLIVLLLLWLFVSDFRLIIFLEDISFCFSYCRIQVKIKVMYVYTYVCMYSSNPRHHTTAVKRVRRFLVLFAEIPFTG